MKSKKKILLVILFLMTLILMVNVKNFYFNTRNEKIENNKNSVEKIESEFDIDNLEENKIDDTNIEIKPQEESFVSEEDNTKIDSKTESKDNNISISDKDDDAQESNNSVISEAKENKEEKNQNNKIEESKPSTDTNNNLDNNSTNNELNKGAWSDLGISEYEYYNSPMWSWARVDFSIDEFKTYEKTREACITRGEEYYEQGYGYSCTGINSYSGKYLGEMLKTF